MMINQNDQPTENLFREVLFIIFAQKRLILEIALWIFVVVLGVAFLAPKQYRSEASLLVKGKKIERDPEMVEQVVDRRL